MNGKNYMLNKHAKTVIDEIKTNAVLKNQAVNLLKEISLVCGVNARKYSNDTKSVFNTDNAISREFEYLQKLIQDFAVKHEIEIKK
tara:strand:+ start:209 stop:466 length:258 start_codon:yes stop_codon:yes gene_type:complete